jgi:hypothetical protein
LPRATTSARTSGVIANSNSWDLLRRKAVKSRLDGNWIVLLVLRKSEAVSAGKLDSIFINLLTSESTIDTSVPDLSIFLK